MNTLSSDGMARRDGVAPSAQGGDAMDEQPGRKPWRERIVEARARGSFTKDDSFDVGCGETCFVGEIARRYGVDYYALGYQNAPPFSERVPEGMHELTVQPIFVVSWNDFDAAERLLDAIEDRALALKREARGSAEPEESR